MFPKASQYLQTMVAGIRIGELGKLSPGPVEVPGVHDHAANGVAVAVDELGGRFCDNISTVVQRPGQSHSSRVVDHKRNLIPVSDLCQEPEIGNIQLGVADSLGIDRPCSLCDGLFELFWL